ncbi:MAG: hypothetical protein BM564_08940 [Bacteroidetes bacterium MedPE-SWsnd-G2]|nr:MAG: hypothetical protein BM564_08940 [Bacteroidetes bacterium MedPE-SWsnd-G2]
MHKPSDKITRQFEGCIKTPNLWVGLGPNQLEQFQLDTRVQKRFDSENLNLKGLRLGKLVEQFLAFQISNSNRPFEVLDANMQIQNGKQTIGEIDLLLKNSSETIHLEIVYKFYLYSEETGNSQLEHWIGPNNKDSLYKKVDKLTHKQLPLLFKEEVRPWLEKYNLNCNDIKQQVLFKGQLFLPYNRTIILEPWINKNSVSGFYLNFSKIELLGQCKFYIPEKLDWLSELHVQVDWMTFEVAKEKLQSFMEKQISPMCWIKYKTGVLKKCFIVWW